jgi:hypothetical protein
MIGAEGARALAAALPHAPLLQTLDLRFNSIGADGARALAAALPHAPLLKMLDVRFNSIGDEGVRALAVALPLAPQLRTLDLHDNLIGDATALPSGMKEYYELKFQRIQVELDHPHPKGLGRFERSVLPALLAAFEPPPVAMVEAICRDQVCPHCLTHVSHVLQGEPSIKPLCIRPRLHHLPPLDQYAVCSSKLRGLDFH